MTIMIVTVDPAEDLSRFVRRLNKANLRVASVMEELHIVTVDADRSALAQVRAMPGVVGASADEMVRLDPREVPDMGARWPARTDQTAEPPATGSSWRSPAWDQGN